MHLSIAILALGLFPLIAAAQTLSIVETDPPPRTTLASVRSAISVRFDRPVDRTSFVPNRTFWAFGRWSGVASGEISFSDADRVATLTPNRPLSAGESVIVVLANTLRGADGAALRSAGYSYTFWTRPREVNATLVQIGVLSTRTTPGQTSRAYGGIASDLDGDGWLDITIVNEDTDDLRIFMNRADGTGQYHNFMTPTFPTGNVPSPSEPADFNHDGIVDICIANTQDTTVSILLGLGDGRFGPAQHVTVGSRPRGICVLDADGDGDLDIVSANFTANNMALLLNNGSGVFGPATNFDGGGSGERAVSAVDMNEDGILDLVIGLFNSARVTVFRGNGDATFTQIGQQNSGGSVWMISAADVNGDGHEDVALVNSSQNTATTLVGNGTGALSTPVSHNVDTFPLATDLGDLDGDGDFDWVTSSFNGDWFLFRNTGGVFSFWQEIPSPQAASCGVFFDFDNDLDLDLALIDELADVVILMENRGTPTCPGDVDADGDVDLADLAMLLGHFGTAAMLGAADGDVDGNGIVDLVDLTLLLAGFGAACP